jgi:hypothetical protein
MKRLLTAAALCFGSLSATAAPAFIAQYDTLRGNVEHWEEKGVSQLRLTREGRTLNLDRNWRNANIDSVTKLNDGNTAMVVSYAEGRCSARQSLIVMTMSTIYGPYELGDCEDTLAYQRSDDGNAFVVMRLAARETLAWVYTVADGNFRGPAIVELPQQLRGLANSASRRAAPAAQSARVAPPAINSKPVLVATRRQESLETDSILSGVKPASLKTSNDTLAEAPAAAKKELAFRPPARVTVPSVPKDLPPSGYEQTPSATSPANPPAPDMAATGISAKQASDVAGTVTKTTRPKTKVVIDLT